MAKSFGPQPTINFIPDQHKCRDISHIHYETLTLAYTQTSYCKANFVIGNFVGTKYFQTFPFASHLGPVSTIFDWVFSAPFFCTFGILQRNENYRNFDRWVWARGTVAWRYLVEPYSKVGWYLTRGSLYLLWWSNGPNKYSSMHHVFTSGMYKRWRKQTCTNADRETCKYTSLFWIL